MTEQRRSAFMTAAITPEQMRERLRPFAAAQPPSWRMEADGRSARIHMYGVIGGFWGDVVASDLVPAIRDLDVDTIEMFINSPGGDAYDGIAIYNALRSHAARVVVTVDGLAASAASIVACAGDEVVMGAGTQFMIHEPWNVAIGSADDLRTEADFLDRLADDAASIYAARAGGEPATWRSLMRAETWYSADEAVEAGFADRIDSAPERQAAASVFDLSAFAHAGRASAPAPAVLRPAAMAQPRKETQMNRTQVEAALAAGTINQEQAAAMLAQIDAFEASLSTTPPAPSNDPARAAEVTAGPVLSKVQPAPVLAITDRITDPREAMRALAAAGNNLSGGDPRHNVRLAIADIIPADDAGEAFVTRPDWIGEVWRAEDTARPYIDAIGTPLPLTSMTTEGWRWGRDAEDEEDPELAGTPDVDEYAGDKAEVPSNEIGTKKVEFGSWRCAAGWDIDRIYVDLGSEAFWSSFKDKATGNYKIKSNTQVRTRLLAAAPDGTTAGGADVDETAAGGISAVLQQLRTDIRSVPGAHANRVFLGSYLYDLIENLKVDDMPLWLKNATVGTGPEEGKAEASQLHIMLDPAMSAKQALVFDSRGIKFRERSPFWIQAENIPHGGVDLGVFSYLALEIHDPRVIVERNYA